MVQPHPSKSDFHLALQLWPPTVFVWRSFMAFMVVLLTDIFSYTNNDIKMCGLCAVFACSSLFVHDFFYKSPFSHCHS